LLLLFVTTDAGHQGGQHRVDAVLWGGIHPDGWRRIILCLRPLRRKGGAGVEEIRRVEPEGVQADGCSSGPLSSAFTAFVTLRSIRAQCFAEGAAVDESPHQIREVLGYQLVILEIQKNWDISKWNNVYHSL
jgi:hypothetical protein